MEVKVIRATGLAASPASPPRPPQLRVAAYCRVSTDNEEQKSSYEAQRNHYTTYIREHPDWTLAGIFADEGISGTQAARRPEFLRMITACENHEVDLVITKSISRFARNTMDCLNYIRRLKALNIPVIFEKESINTMEASGEVLITILASIAQQESASISQNVKMGIRYIMREGRGRVNYSQFLGYTKGATPGSLEIVPAEAEVVRRIYREYLDGYSPALIASHLEAAHVSTPTGGRRWHASTIASILRNEKYCGDLLLQKYFTQDFLTHKIVRNTGQLPQYFVENHHEPIIPKKVFAQVQGERKRRSDLRLQPSQLRYGRDGVLSGRLVCGICGRTLKRCTRDDGAIVEWRCCDRATAWHAESPPTEGDCALRPLLEADARIYILTAFNRLPSRRDRLRAQREGLLSGPIARIDWQLAGVARRQRLLEDCMERLSGQDRPSASAVVEQRIPQATLPEGDPLRRQAEGIERLRASLTVERARHAHREMQLRNLLDLIDWMRAPLASPQPAPTSPACCDYEDFFLRTNKPLPAGTLDTTGRFVTFDDTTVARYLDHVTVFDNHVDVVFKAGVTIAVARYVAAGNASSDNLYRPRGR